MLQICQQKYIALAILFLPSGELGGLGVWRVSMRYSSSKRLTKVILFCSLCTHCRGLESRTGKYGCFQRDLGCARKKNQSVQCAKLCQVQLGVHV